MSETPSVDRYDCKTCKGTGGQQNPALTGWLCEDCEGSGRCPTFNGYHECPCCGEVLCGGPLDEPRCDSCEEADCDVHSCEDEGCDDSCEDDGMALEGCNVPTCECCEERMSFMNDRAWHDNCEADECERKRTEGSVSHA
jgi:hypothetical protein